jgi:hypothetical protein
MSGNDPVQVLPVVNTEGAKLAVPIVIPSSKLALYASLAAVALGSVAELLRSVIAILHGSGS